MDALPLKQNIGPRSVAFLYKIKKTYLSNVQLGTVEKTLVIRTLQK